MKQQYNKSLAILNEIAIPYQPKRYTKKDLERAEVFNIERITELVMAAVGGYDFVDEKYRDFNCVNNTDCKTSTVRKKDKGITISAVENKIGGLRVVAYNELVKCLHYFFMPYAEWKKIEERKPTKSIIRGTYNVKRDCYNKLQKYRVSCFETLATITEDQWYKNNQGMNV